MEQSSSSGQHAEPASGSNCMCCWDDLEATTYVEYRCSASSDWLPSGYCTGKAHSGNWLADLSFFCSPTVLTGEFTNWVFLLKACIDQLLLTQWSKYTTALEKTTCKAEQRRLLAKGPPINISDPKALPCPDGGEVHSLWYMVDLKEHSAKLEGSLAGKVGLFYWNSDTYIHDWVVAIVRMWY